MKKKKIRKKLNQTDREFISIFFNIAQEFKEPKNEFDIDAHLSKNFIKFFIFCDFIYKNKDKYTDLKQKLKSELDLEWLK